MQVPGGDLISVHSFDEKQTLNAMSENNFISFDNDYTKWNGFDQGVWIGLHHSDKVSSSY